MDTPESREADPARPLKEIAEDTLPRGLLEARSEDLVILLTCRLKGRNDCETRVVSRARLLRC